MYSGFGDIQIKPQSLDEISSAYKKFDTAFRSAWNLITQLDEFVRFKRQEASKEELIFAQRLLTQLEAFWDYLKKAKEIFGAMLGKERITGRKGRTGKITLGIREFALLIRTLTLVEKVEDLEKIRSRIIRVYEPGKRPEIVRKAENHLDAIIGDTKAALKIAKELIEKTMEQVKKRCECDPPATP